MNDNAMETVQSPSNFRTAFGCTTDFLNNRFVYIVISPRMRGLAIGVNVSPEGNCNFECICCELCASKNMVKGPLDLTLMATELQQTVKLVQSGRLKELPGYSKLVPELLRLRQVVISGNGEPTLAPAFGESVKRIVHQRSRKGASYFKIVLPTNGSFLDSEEVQASLRYLTREDEIWIKLDAGTQEHMSRINRGSACLKKVMSNILLVGKRRPVVIQSIFPLVRDQEPTESEISDYIDRLIDLKNGGANISLVHIYSAARPALVSAECGHLPLKSLSAICQRIRSVTGLKAEIF